MVHATLEYTAAVTMSSNLDTVRSNGIVDELVVFWCKLIKALLNDVVAVEVLDEYDDVQAERDDDGVDLPTRREEVDHLLHGTCAVHVEGDINQILGNGLADDVALLIGAELQKLLTQVVAEGVYTNLINAWPLRWNRSSTYRSSAQGNDQRSP